MAPSSSSRSLSMSWLRVHRRWVLPAALVLVVMLCVCVISPVKAAGINKRKFSDAELEKIAEQWDDADEEDDEAEEEEEEDQGPPPKSEMAFVSLKTPMTKSETSKWVGQVVDVLTSGGVEVKGYAVDAARGLFVCERGLRDLLRVRHYVLKQRNVVIDWEYNQQKSEPQKPRAGQTDAQLDAELDEAEAVRLRAVGASANGMNFHPASAAPPGMAPPPTTKKAPRRSHPARKPKSAAAKKTKQGDKKTTTKNAAPRDRTVHEDDL